MVATEYQGSIYILLIHIAINSYLCISRTLTGPILDMPNSEFVIGGGSFVGTMQDIRYYSTVLNTK